MGKKTCGRQMNSSADDCLEFPSCMIDTFSRKDLVSTHVILVSISCLARCTLARVDTEDLIKTQR
jgi:hypothetical protein